MSTEHILAIETSCDETAIAVLRKNEAGLTVLSNEISSQVKLHAAWGGVVPNLAAREHVKNIRKILELSLAKARIGKEELDLIAVTNGPGLIPALMVGVNFARTLAYLWEKPLIGIHHIEGHIYANFINENLADFSADIAFPVLCLVVSGGHTQLVHMEDHLRYEIVGQTLDDAVGEAFDKAARILGIGYPGGPIVSELAAKYAATTNKHSVSFPRPMLNKKNFDFSFSGLKTAVLYEAKKNPGLLEDQEYAAAVCHEFQQAAVDVLVAKTLKAAEKYRPKTVLLAGGVSANRKLRAQLGDALKKDLPGVSYAVPDLALTGDNAAMIAAAAAFRWEKMTDAQKKKALEGWQTLGADANLRLE